MNTHDALSKYMNVNSKCKIVYCGLDQKVFQILFESQAFNLMAVNAINDFVTYSTNNPIDFLFKWVYQYKLKHNIGIKKDYIFYIVVLIFEVYKKLSFCSSRLYQQYTQYLGSLLYNNIRIIDFENVQQTVDFINQEKIGVIIVSNWWLLPDNIINAPTFKTVNIHPSKLPKYRGSVPTLWALKNKDTQTAVSFMILDSGMDSGKLISQYDVPINSMDDSISLENKTDNTIRQYLVEDILKYINGEIKLTAQNSSDASLTAKYYPYMKIDWINESACEIVNKIKLYPHLWHIHRCYTFYKGRKIEFKSASIPPSNKMIDKMQSLKPGEFIITTINVFAKTKNGIVCLRLFHHINFKDSIFLLSHFMSQKQRCFVSIEEDIKNV